MINSYDIINLIKPELLILVPIIIFIGFIIKKSKIIKTNYIPIILAIISIMLSSIYVVATSTDVITYNGILITIFTAITQGLIVALSSVGLNQVKKQLNKVKEEVK